jgi:hypothetical protein
MRSYFLGLLTEFLKVSFDVTFEHPNRTANMPQRRQLTSLGFPPHCALAHTKDSFQFIHANQTIIEPLLFSGIHNGSSLSSCSRCVSG